jgi:flagellar biogenesis protein FliO
MKNIINKNLITLAIIPVFMLAFGFALPVEASFYTPTSFTTHTGASANVIIPDGDTPSSPYTPPYVPPTTPVINNNNNLPTVPATPIIGSITPDSIGSSIAVQENFGEYSAYWKFDTNTNTDPTKGNPGLGDLRFNSTTVTKVTEITISDTDKDSIDRDSFLDNLSNANKYGLIRISNQDGSKFLYGEIKSVSDRGEFHWLKVVYKENLGNLFQNGEIIEFSFQPTGSVGFGTHSTTVTEHKCSDNNKNITILGKNFIKDSVAEFDGSPRMTTYINSKNLSMQLTTTDVCNVGDHMITVDNGEYSGGVSNDALLTVNKTSSSSSLNLGANALSSGFMPSNLFEWILLLIIILLFIILVRKIFFAKRNITLQVTNLTETSVTLNATGLISNSLYVIEIIGALGPNRVQVVGTKDGTANATFSNLASGNHFTATIKKHDPRTGLLANIPNAPVVYFDTLKTEVN